jgi:ubiquinone/menaquinone biosynthesis C-methylase UbiE
MNSHIHDVAEVELMPRGGPGASWLSRRLQTDRLEFTDRYDISDDLKQKVIGTLDTAGMRMGLHENNARLALKVVADRTNPRILELGAGHGRLSEKILELHPSATVTVTDLDPTSVANIASGALGSHPRATTKVIDATSITYPDTSFDLVVFAASFHHLPPRAACQAIAEATRVGRQFLVIDLERPSPLAMIPSLLLMPLMTPRLLATSPLALLATMHDGSISMLRAYSRSALVALGKAADASMVVDFLPLQSKLPSGMAALFTRAT